MAAGTAVKPATLGLSSGPESIVLMTATNIDVDTNLDFNIIGPCEAIEVTLVSGTAKTGTPSVVLNLQVFDIASGTFLTTVSAAALTDAGNAWVLQAHDATPVTNKVVGRVVREQMRVNLDYTGTPVTDVLNNVTVTVSAV